MCKDLELFEKWDTAENDAMNVDELAKLIPCEAALLGWHILEATMSEGRVLTGVGRAPRPPSRLDEAFTTRTSKRPVVLAFGGQTGRTVTASRDLYDTSHIFSHHLVCTLPLLTRFNFC